MPAARPKLSAGTRFALYSGMSASRHIRFCTSADGTRIAVACEGAGPVLLRAAHWLTHVAYDHESPVWRPWIRGLSRDHCYVRYDQRGCGLSDRFVREISFRTWMEDLDAVVATLPDRPFALLGMSQGGALAITYALRHPERVSHLILYGAYGQGAAVRARTEEERLEAETLVNLVRVGWARDNPAFRQVFTNTFIPGGTAEQHDWWNDLERRTASPDTVVRTLQEVQRIDVLDSAGGLRVPTLVLHSRGDLRVPFEEGCRLAQRIPGARFVALDSRNHVLLGDEPAWQVFQDELARFLAPPDAAPRAARDARLTLAEAEVLRLVATGIDNRAIARQLGKSEKTVRNQITAILDKLGVHSRAEAIVRALSG